jgi:hypothetical protein
MIKGICEEGPLADVARSSKFSNFTDYYSQRQFHFKDIYGKDYTKENAINAYMEMKEIRGKAKKSFLSFVRNND